MLQIVIVASFPISAYLKEESNSVSSLPSHQEVEDSNMISCSPSLLEADQSSFPQPFSMHHVLQTSLTYISLTCAIWACDISTSESLKGSISSKEVEGS